MRTHLLTSFLVVLVLGSCGGGGGGDDGSSSGAVGDFLIGDAPADDLLSFSARVEDLRLVGPGGALSPNLLSVPVSLEMLALHSKMRWLARASLPPGTWSSIRVGFAPASVEARDTSGQPVAVSATSAVLEAHMPSTIHVGSSGYRRWVVDLDLLGSLSGSVSSPPLEFHAQGTALGDDGGPEIDLDDVRGLVRSADAASSSLVVDSWADDDCSVPLGPIAVLVPPEALLLDIYGAPLSRAEFFSAMRLDLTFLEMRGLQSRAGMQAQRIQIEDQQGGMGTQAEVQIDGVIASLGPGSSFSLMIQGIEKGASIVAPVLAWLGDPPTITVAYDGSTSFVVGDRETGDPGMLAIGERVEVKFPLFDSPPFHASRVGIEDSPGFLGTITSLAGLPGSMVMHLDPMSLAIASGQVVSENTNVTVLLPGSTWRLDLRTPVELPMSQLLSGMRVSVHGVLSGPPTAPTIDADHEDCWVRPGRCTGTVQWSMMGSFGCSSLQILEPFGGGTDQGALSVRLAPACFFHGDAWSTSEFYSMCQGMPYGSVHVDIRGIGTGDFGEVQAFEIDSWRPY